jgi:hypothetical protein
MQAYIESSHLSSAFALFGELTFIMKHKRLTLLPETFLVLLRGCDKANDHERKKLVHQKMVEHDFDIDLESLNN